MIGIIIASIIIVFSLLLVLRMPVAFAFGLVGFLGICYLEGIQKAFVALYTIPFSQISNYVWVTLPLYVLFGELASNTKLTTDFFTGARAWLGHVKGGILHAIIVGNAAFGACCGVSLAAASSFTGICLPESRKYDYSDEPVLGAVCGSSSLSTLIPPSTGMVMFGILTQTSISELFIAGLIPGLILTILFMGAALFVAVRNPKAVPLAPKASRREKGLGLLKMIPLAIIFIILIGGLYFGLFTPTEGAGVSVIVVIILGLIRRTLNWGGVKDSMLKTIRMAVSTLFLLAGTMIFNSYLTLTGFGNILSNGISQITNSPIGFMLIVAIIMVILGMFIDVAPLSMLLVPLLFPISRKFGVDPVQFGVIWVMLGATGTVSPPFGVVTYTVGRLVPEIPIMKIFKATYPYMIMILAIILILMFIPQVSLILVNAMRTY